MNTEDHIPTEEQEGGSPADRRREQRVHFVEPCFLTVISPAWAMTATPIAATSEDITTNGMRIDIARMESTTVRSWKEAVPSDTELSVNIAFPARLGFPKLHGQIVWIHPDGDLRQQMELPCSVGILFSIMKEKEIQALLGLIDQLT